MRLTDDQRKVLAILLNKRPRLEAWAEETNQTVAAEAGLSAEDARRIIDELYGLKYIDEAFKNRPGGDKVLWELTPLGRDALATEGTT